jgi:biopolymer transport protein ExbB
LVSGPFLQAQEAVVVEGGGQMTMNEAIQAAGWPIYLLGFLSVLAVGFIIYFFMVLRLEQVAPRALRREILNKINAGQLAEARVACEYRSCPLSSIALSALDYMEHDPNPDPIFLKDVVESEGARQAVAIQDSTQYLMDVAVVAPMVGLFGTVLGFMGAFNAVAGNAAKAQPIELAGGVSQALITTLGGLMVGIPAMMFYSYFRGRGSRLISNIEVASHDILTALLRKRGV